MNRPSSTITASVLTGLAIAAMFATVNEFTDISISPGYVATIVTLVSGIVGYLKPEKVLKVQK